MAEIPQYIRDTAKKVRDQLCIDCECTFDRGCGCLDAVTAALIAERERCAKIAEHRAEIARTVVPAAVFALLNALATAIRQDRGE